LLAGQSNITQTITNGSSTGGTVNGYNQTITVNNTSSASTTNGLNISLADSTSLSNSNVGIKVSLTGNANATNIGVDVSADRAVALRAIANSSPSGSVACGSLSLTGSTGLCASGGIAGGIGETSGGTAFSVTTGGAGFIGVDSAAGSAANNYAGIKGFANTSSAAAYTSAGVFGQATGGVGATVYGGNFILGGGGATLGAALYASNTSVAANILELQDGTSTAKDVLVVADEGATTFSNRTNSSAAFQIQNAASGSLFNVNSTDSVISINSTNNGIIQNWQTGANSLPVQRDAYGTASVNGYIYIIGGQNNGNGDATPIKSTVYYSKLNADGSVGTWNCQGASSVGAANSCGTTGVTVVNSNTLPAARADLATVYANGYLYAIGGNNGTNSQTTIYYARVNPDGSTQAWLTAATPLPVARDDFMATIVNGYLYAIGGQKDAGIVKTVLHAKLSADGSIGAWSCEDAASTNCGSAAFIGGNGLPNSIKDGGVALANGYVYITGGSNGSAQSSVYYAPFNSDGTMGTWGTATALGAAVDGPTTFALNGYVYVVGGGGAKTVYYGKPNNTGNITAWTSDANVNHQLPLNRAFTGFHGIAVNGYMYIIGGTTTGGAAGTNTVYYASAPRTQIAGSLDLVGISSQDLLNAGNQAGSLTAGNTNILGSLTLQGQASFNNSLSVNGSFVSNSDALFKDYTNSVSAFQIQNSGGAQLLNIDTTTQNIITNGSFEDGASTTGWAAKGSAAIAQESTQAYVGTKSLKVTTTALANDGAKYNLTTTTLASNTAYTLSFYIRGPYGNQNNNNGTNAYTNILDNLDYGRADNGAADTSCLSSNQTASFAANDGWTQVTCTFTTGTTSGTPYIYIKQSDAKIKNIFIDGVMLTRTSLLTNSSIEQAVAGNWVLKGAATVAQSSAQAFDGTNSLLITTTNAATDGAKQNITLNDSTTYRLVFYARADSTTTRDVPDMEAGYSSDGSTDNTVCMTAQRVPVGGWASYSCRFTTPSGHSGTPYLYIKQNSAPGVGGSKFYIDAAQLTIGNPLTSYQEGTISLNGIINSPAVFQNQSNSTTAFQVQNSMGTALLNVDTLSNQINLAQTYHSGNILVGTSATTTTALANVFTNVDQASVTGANGKDQTGWNPSVAIAPDGLPVISYFDYGTGAASGALKILKCSQQDCSNTSTNTISVADNNINAGGVGAYSTIAIGPDGLPSIAYRDNQGGDIKFIKCLNSSCSQNKIMFISALNAGGYYISMAFGLDGLPIIAAYDDNTTDVVVGNCTDAFCSSATVTHIDVSANDSGWYTSIAVPSDGKPVISEYYNTGQDLRLIKCGNSSCSSGNTVTTVETTNNVGLNSRVAIGADGLPVVAYISCTASDCVTASTNRIKVAKCTVADCSSTSINTVDSSMQATAPSGSPGQGLDLSMAIGPDGMPLLAYMDASANGATGGLRTFHCSTISCSAGTANAVDSQNNSAYYTTMAIGTDGLPLIPEVVNPTTNYLRVAHCASLTCASGSQTAITGGLSLGGSAAALQNAFINNLQTGTNASFNLSTNGVTRMVIDTAGNTTFKGTNSTTAFQVQNSTGGSLFKIDSTNSVATLLGLGSGNLGTWSSTTALNTAVRANRSVIASNGYLYVTGGVNAGSPQNIVQYGKLNADGTISSWTTSSNNIPQTLGYHSAVTANGYLYIIGGDNGGALSTVYYAKLKSDGSTSTFSTGTPITNPRRYHAAVAYNGYIYVIGGDSAGTAASTVYYSRLNADGSNSSWTTSVQPLPGARRYVSASVANGYLYVLGGQDNTPTDQATVYYAKLNTDGSTGAWTTNVSNPLPQTRVDGSVNVSNGNIYYIGGVYSVTGLSQSTVYNAPLNTDGSVGAWNTTNALTSPRDQMSAVIANGYIYVPGGNNSGEQSTVYYTSTSRLQIGANLDLVGIQGGNLAEDGGIGTGSSGGSLTAGNTRIVGILNVQNDGVFAGSVTIGRSLTASESVLFQNGTNTTSAFQVQNSGGAQLINVDTTNPTTDITNNTANNLVSNASFETGTTGWAAIGGSTLSQNNNLRYIGNDSLLIATTTTAGGDGASFGLTTTTLASNTQYNLSLYARTDHGQSMSTFEIGRADDGTTKTSCATAQTLSGNGWTRINCTFTTGTTSSTPYIYAKQTDTVARNIYIDAVTLTRVSILSNSSAEQAFTASDWIAKAGATVTRDTTQFNDGAASVKIATSVTASNNDGAKHNITLNDSTQYVLNFYAKLDSGSTALTTMEAGYSSDGSTDNTTCITGQTVVSTGWTNYMCRFTTPSSHSGTPFLYIKELNTTGVKTFYVDTVLLTIGNPLSAYREGQIALNGVITSPVALQNQTNSTTAFQIQNSLGSSLLVADTLNFNIKVYDSTGANYASISATSSSATFKSNIGTTVVGAGSRQCAAAANECRRHLPIYS
jgi:hypothetical protein